VVETDPQPLEVRLTVDGGFAPLGPTPRVYRVATADLGPADAERLRRAVAATVQSETGPERLSGMPDVLVYRLEMRGHAAVFDDVTATPGQHELVALVMELAGR